MNKVAFDLEDRLIEFAVRIVSVVESLPASKAGKHIGSQLIRSGTSPAPNYGEAQSAESRKDFVHKLKIALKELRETNIWLKIIDRTRMCGENRMDDIISECGELTAILVKSVQTAKKNMLQESS